MISGHVRNLRLSRFSHSTRWLPLPAQSLLSPSSFYSWFQCVYTQPSIPPLYGGSTSKTRSIRINIAGWCIERYQVLRVWAFIGLYCALAGRPSEVEEIDWDYPLVSSLSNRELNARIKKVKYVIRLDARCLPTLKTDRHLQSLFSIDLGLYTTLLSCMAKCPLNRP